MKHELLLKAAVAEGLLPADAQAPATEHRPWPVVLLTALGAWIAAIPLMGLVFALLGGLLDSGAGSYLVGAAVLAGALSLMRRPGLPLFVEQLALPALMVGAGLLGFALFRDLPMRIAALLLLGLVLALATWLQRPWLRVLLGAAAAALLSVQLLPSRWFDLGGGMLSFWLAPHLLLLVWAVALWVQQRHLLDGPRVRRAALIEALAGGWVLVALAGLCWLAGMTFLVGGVLGGSAAGGLALELGSALSPALRWLPLVMRAGSLGFALAGALLLARCWPGCRRPLFLMLAAVLAALAWLLPSLGGALFALALLAVSQRWRLAGAAAVAVAWIIGSFYYQLHWPLGQKALLLLGLGALLGLLSWLTQRRAAAPAAPAAPARGRWVLLCGAAAVLLVASGAIWQKERLIREGRPVFVALAPVDPRSLMQGDFMRLNFALPAAVETPLLQDLGSQRPRLVARLDGRGVAQLLRLHASDAALAEGELLLELTPKDGRWVLVSDAWFFEEGRAAAFEAARFGEFRVLPDGRALLVGMADQNLHSISAQAAPKR
ncbi:GDYXXLXY domain-containing protein [Paucibacter sp. M5-1]|uniref:GDYXXLXY domain-containing protein n=1 Tax=Paucibacter sp. M5-1 TaxID=3015998 RepID=UPI0022B8E025|nr:GDYXXLXY domain-containing protein [Paucibacter sp. M5-1]MCZ7880336.1 GDYXXLXY domain-containing protein [Paucibacter sp. M5-1]